jgi:hypothetical protein
LQCAELTVGDLSGRIAPQTIEEVLGGAIGFRFQLQPHHNLRPDRLERIGPRAPMARRLRASPVRRPDLTPLPGMREALEESLEVGNAVGNHMDGMARRQPRR